MMQGLRPPETEFDERVRNDYSHHLQGPAAELRRRTSRSSRRCSGFCVAGGTEILTCTDIRVAADDARFGLAEVKWSLFPMGGSTVRLPRQIPYCNAMEILLTGEQHLRRSDALQMGLINKVVPRGEVMAEALRYAASSPTTGPLAVQAVKRSVLAGLGLPHRAGAREARWRSASRCRCPRTAARARRRSRRSGSRYFGDGDGSLPLPRFSLMCAPTP